MCENEVPEITYRNVAQIFVDPIFDHKKSIEPYTAVARQKVVNTLQSSMAKIAADLSSPRNYKKFHWSKDTHGLTCEFKHDH